MPGGQGGPRFPGFGVGRGFAIWGPFPVHAPDTHRKRGPLSTRRPAGLNSPVTRSSAGFVMREIQTGLHKPESATKQRLTKSARNSAPICFPNCASICLGSRVSFDLPLAQEPCVAHCPSSCRWFWWLCFYPRPLSLLETIAAPACMILMIFLEARPRAGAIKATPATDLMVFPAVPDHSRPQVRLALSCCPRLGFGSRGLVVRSLRHLPWGSRRQAMKIPAAPRLAKAAAGPHSRREGQNCHPNGRRFEPCPFRALFGAFCPHPAHQSACERKGYALLGTRSTRVLHRPRPLFSRLPHPASRPTPPSVSTSGVKL